MVSRILPPHALPGVHNEPLPQNRIFGRHQHLVYDIPSSRPEQGYDVNGIGHLSSNTKIAALALIARVRGVEYLQQNMGRLTRMMSQSHNDATIVEVSRALNYSGANVFAANFRPMTMQGGVLNRGNDNHLSNTMNGNVQRFYETYRAELAKYQTELGIAGSRFRDTSGIADRASRIGTSQASPLHVAHLVDYLYKLDNGKTLSQLATPANPQHTTHRYLAERAIRDPQRPRNGEIFFAKTGTLDVSQFHKLPAGSGVPQQFPTGVFVLTLGYIQDGKPKMAFIRANSSEERKQLANRFLDDVAGTTPQLIAQRRTQPFPPTA
ncbi:MAG: hypothetical protein SFW65_00735 [Alphaproteobacteria bacterium]|nr:hypothetical protein [Alphaproteobacteria bacterium]